MVAKCANSKFSTEELDLLVSFWSFLTETPLGRGANLQDFLFASLCNKFGSPCLSTKSSWVAFPSDRISALCRVCIFDLRSLQSGIVERFLASENVLHSKVHSSLAREAALKGFSNFIKNSAKQVDSAPLPVLATSVSAEMTELISSWEKDSNSGVSLTNRQRGSEKLYESLHKQFQGGKI